MRGPRDLTLRDETIDARTRLVAPRGEIDAVSAPHLGRCLLRLVEAGVRGIVIDLSAVSFMDSTGLGVMLNALRRISVRRGSLVVVAPNERVRRPFEVTGLVGHLRIFDSREDALDALPAAG